MSLSPNYDSGRNGNKPDIIVCHITEGGYSGSVSWLCNPSAQASTHFVVSADGRSTQLVNLEDTAWGNGNSSNPSDSAYYQKALNPTVKTRPQNANLYTYSIEHEGYSYKERFGALTEAQYQASLAVMKKIITHMKNTYGVTFQPDRDHLIGHCHISPVNKVNCPAPNYGKNFPFDRFITDLKAWMSPKVSAAPLPPVVSPPTGVLHRVQVGAYGVYNNAVAKSLELDSKGYSTYIVRVGNLYKVQVGAFATGREKAEALANELKTKGYETYITTQAGIPVSKTQSIAVGSKVKVVRGAKTYTGGLVSPFVYDNVYTVDYLTGDRAVLDEGGIFTPFNIKDLIIQ